jgi:hypothetical protein
MHRQSGQAESASAELSGAEHELSEIVISETGASGPGESGTAGSSAGESGTAESGTGLPGSGLPAAVPASLLEAAMERVAPEPGVPDPGSRLASVRDFLGELRQRAAGAASWLESSDHYAQLLNSAGVVPVTARFDAHDLAFLGRAREDLLSFADLGLRLADLHRPLDAGGTTSDPANPALRCRSCMWRWPCPTFRLLTEYLADRGR